MSQATHPTIHASRSLFDPETAPRVPPTRQVAPPEPTPATAPCESRMRFVLGLCGNVLAGGVLLLTLLALPGVVAMLAGLH